VRKRFWLMHIALDIFLEQIRLFLGIVLRSFLSYRIWLPIQQYLIWGQLEIHTHTTRSEHWLSKFDNYSKISFILQIPFDACYQRAKTRPEYANYTEERYRVLYYGFKFLCLFKTFNQYVGVKEFCINAQSDSSSVADKIIEMI